MQIAIHFGAHCTDEDKLIRCLARNRDLLAEEGIVIPGPGRYRQLMRKTMQASDGSLATPEAEQALLDAILDEDQAERMVLSYENFLCVPHRVLGEGMFYPMAGERARVYAAMFPGQELSYFMALRNPATLIPALITKVEGADYGKVLSGCDPQALRWSETVIAMREAAPHVPLTVWCDEDTPLIWPEVLREISGHDPSLDLDGATDILSEIMTADGFKKLNAYLADNPPPNELQRRRIVSAFLSKFARPEAIEIELDLPGWTEDYVAALNENYDDDMETIARLPGVTFIGP
jgi:hypothetical protein